MDIWGFVIFCITILPLASPKEKSVDECNDYSGKVYYDPADGVCKCDRSKCFSRRDPPGIQVREEECVYLYGLDCREGMQPDPSESHCVPCPDGTFKSEVGCNWCIQMTTCNATQWITFNGNRTTDRTCSDTNPEVVTRNEIVNYTESDHSSSDTTTTTYEEETKTEINSTNPSDFFYIFCCICGAALLAAVVFAAFKVSCDRCRTSRPKSVHFQHDVEKGKNENDKKQTPIRKGMDQMYIHQVDEAKKCEHAERPKDSMKARGEATIGQSLDEGMHQTTPKICEYSSTGVDGKKIKDAQEIEDRSSSLGLSSVLNDRFTLSERP